MPLRFEAAILSRTRSPITSRSHRGEHEPILDRDLFEAVQAKLAANAVDRQVRLRGSPAILTGRIFDDRGNRMSPTHSNKLGVRYRYYVSHAILQKRKAEAGNIARVPAAEIEKLVLDGVRKHRASIGEAEQPTAIDDRDLIERYVERIVVKPEAIEVRLLAPIDERAPTGGDDHGRGRPRSIARRAHPKSRVIPYGPSHVCPRTTGFRRSATRARFQRHGPGRGYHRSRTRHRPAALPAIR